MKRFGVLIVGGAAAALFARLGLWQLDRLAVRRAISQSQESKLARPPVLVDTLPARVLQHDSLSFHPGAARGVFDFQRQIVVTGRSMDGVPAVFVATPLVLADGRALLVERGGVYSPDSRTVDLNALSEPDSAIARGVLMYGVAGRWTRFQGDSWPIHTGSDDPTQFAEQFPYPLVRLVLRRTVPPLGAPDALRPIPLPPIGNGPHLSYAIQWFAFAVIAVVGSIALFRRTASPRSPLAAHQQY